MFEKLKEIIKNKIFSKDVHSFIQNQSMEIEWAHIYHDSIRGKKSIEELNLNIGRWAGNYSFFYILNRILSDFKPTSILEFGLGESSKFISTYLDNYLPNSMQYIVEHDKNWIESFKERFTLSDRSSIIYCELENKFINNFEVSSYKDFELNVNKKVQFYIIDGPFGSQRYSRYDIISLVNKFEKNEEFIILFDDTNRQGEIDTVNSIKTILIEKNIKFYTSNYVGNKSNTIIATEKYKYSTSL